MNNSELRLEKSNIKKRLLAYFLGLFIMALGISMSVKSNLGVSPVSSILYTITCITGLEMGKATIVFHIFLVLLQIAILRKEFKIKNLLQIAVGIVFRIILMLGSTVLIAAGIFLYLPSDIVPLAGEGAMMAISDKTHIKFNRIKIAFDVSMVTISLISCIIVLKSLGSVGIGTVAAALLVGIVLGFITKIFGEKRDKVLGLVRID